MTFINFTSHPSTGWGEKQLQAALQYGIIVDLPFPEVPEGAEEGDVKALANQYAEQIRSSYSSQDAVVHVMGEMTFTFAFVTILKSLGYRCVASTTRRIVEIDAEGVKKVKFDFCRFREY